MFDWIAFDADDTLWHNEILYAGAQENLRELLSPYADGKTVDHALYQKEMSNLALYGYGIKSFALSMIETAIELSGDKVSAAEVGNIIGFAREMLTAEVQLLDDAASAVMELSRSHHLMVITKGDLRDQESKLARCGIREYFDEIEIVSEKTSHTYERLMSRYGITPDRFLMVGNSLKSDILPVVAAGGHAVYIPYHTTWVHEIVEDPMPDRDGYHQMTHLGELPAWVTAQSERAKQD